MGGEPDGDATEEAGLPSRLFGGVDRHAAEEAIAAVERRADGLAAEVDRLRQRLSAQEAELAQLRSREPAITAALMDAQASADQLRARSERMAHARLREAQSTVRDLRRHARDINLDLLRHVKQATETLDRLARVADELPVEDGPEGGTPVAEEPAAGVASGPPRAEEPSEAEAVAPEELAPEELSPEEPTLREPDPPAPPPAAASGPAPSAALQVPPTEPMPIAPVYGEEARATPEGPPAGRLEVQVRPVRSGERASAFERRLLELDGVRHVRLDGFGEGSATFTIEIDGEGPDLLPLMEERVQILSVSGNRIELRLPGES